MNTNHPHRGSDFRSFLEETGMCEEVEALAMKKAIALKLQSLLKDHALTKTEMAKRMKTSRAAVDRLLDETNPSITLLTLEKGAMALGHRLKIELVPAV